MLNVFTLANGRLFQEEIESLEELTRFKPIWVDLESPTPEERRWVRQHFGLSIPEDAMDEDIEESARFFEEDNGELHIRSDFLIDDEDKPRSVRVAFILNQQNAELNSHGVLFSIHDEDVPVFRLLRLRARRMPGLIADAKDVLLSLFDTDAEYCADTVEDIYDELDEVSRQVLAGDVTDNMAGEVLAAIVERVHLPFMQELERTSTDQRDTPVHDLRAVMIHSFIELSEDERLRKTMEIMLRSDASADTKVLTEMQQAGFRDALDRMERALRRAQDLGQLREGADPKIAARMLHATVLGVLHGAMVEPELMDLKRDGMLALDMTLAAYVKEGVFVPGTVPEPLPEA